MVLSDRSNGRSNTPSTPLVQELRREKGYRLCRKAHTAFYAYVPSLTSESTMTSVGKRMVLRFGYQIRYLAQTCGARTIMVARILSTRFGVNVTSTNERSLHETRNGIFLAARLASKVIRRFFVLSVKFPLPFQHFLTISSKSRTVNYLSPTPTEASGATVSPISEFRSSSATYIGGRAFSSWDEGYRQRLHMKTLA